MKKETLASIATRTGFSITTISRVLTGNAERYRISKATCDAVTSAAEQMNYYRSPVAQNLRTMNSRLVGLILPSIANPYFSEMASVIMSDLEKSGYTTLMVDAMENEAKFSDALKSLISKQVEGIIAIPCGNNRLELEYYSRQCPLVTVDRYYPNSFIPYVSTDNYKGGCEGTTELLSRGYKRIAVIQGVISSVPNKERVRGYTDTMKSAGLEENILVVGNDFSIQNGYLETKLLIERKERPEAIFSMSGTIMLGTLKALHESGLSIPEDVAIISYDSNIYMDFLTPTVARIKQPKTDMGSLAVKILLDKISGENALNSQILLSPTFVLGKSI